MSPQPLLVDDHLMASAADAKRFGYLGPARRIADELRGPHGHVRGWRVDERTRVLDGLDLRHRLGDDYDRLAGLAGEGPNQG